MATNALPQMAARATNRTAERYRVTARDYAPAAVNLTIRNSSVATRLPGPQ
jgi:hypothetical protein